jgi:DNA-directed RNA polymerase subunit RPC12/RpoP
MPERLSRDTILEIISNTEYTFLDSYISKGKTKVKISDKNGYKYDIHMSVFREKRKPNFVDKSNLYSIENISLWLKINNKNFYLDFENVYRGSSEKLNFVCSICNEKFPASWGKVLRGQGCSFCSGKRVGEKNSLYNLRQDLIKEWSPKNTISPREVTLFSFKTAIWKCLKCGHEWRTPIARRTSMGTGCPKCKESSGEKRISNWLSDNNIFFIRQFVFSDCRNINVLPFDFYIPNINMCIEYNGIQHYSVSRGFFGGEDELEKRQNLDAIKKQYCKANRIRFLEIPYTEFKNIDGILTNSIL